MKECRVCGIEQTIENYTKNKNKSDGHYSECKDCVAIYRKKWYQEHKEELYERTKKYQKKNRDKINSYYREYYAERKELFKERNAKYYYERKERQQNERN